MTEPSRCFPTWLVLCSVMWGGAVAHAITITGYSSTNNDRFSSGFSSSPVPNSSGTFVGIAYDWSGVGWSTTDGTKGFGFITPQHYLVARHYGGAADIRIQSPDETLHTVAQASVTNTNYGAVVGMQRSTISAMGRSLRGLANWA